MRKVLTLLGVIVAVLAFAGCGASHPAPAIPSPSPGTTDTTLAPATAICPSGQCAAGSVHPPGWGLPAAPGNYALAPTAVPTATMYDSITLATVPASPFALAGYTAGAWPTYAPMRNAYPRSHTVSIAISARYHADCLDVEPGDARPSDVVGWIRADIAAGFSKPCVYSSFWEYVNQIRPLLNAAHIARSAIFEWDADYVYHPRLDATFDATQYTDRAFGANLDASVVTLGFLSIAQPPYVAPKPKPKPVPKPKPKPARTWLVPGDRGARVRALLGNLTVAHWFARSSDYYSRHTARVVAEFQRAHGLRPATGIAGERTQLAAALAAARARRHPANHGRF